MLSPVNRDATYEPGTFPAAGVTARRWRRFEREYRLWLETPHGSFAVWRAERALDQSRDHAAARELPRSA